MTKIIRLASSEPKQLLFEYLFEKLTLYLHPRLGLILTSIVVTTSAIYLSTFAHF